MTLAVAGLTDCGRVRSSNEDALWWDAAAGLLLVADGMGGHNAGEVASHLAIQTIREFLQPPAGETNAVSSYRPDPELSPDGNRLATALKLANQRVLRAADQQPAWAGMGTTIVAAIVGSDVLTYAGVGDSRLYRRRRDGVLEQLTRDDSWVTTVLAQDPMMTPAALASHPMRHVLTNVIGGADDLRLDVRDTRLAPGDRLLLSTDGLHGVVDEATVRDTLGGDATISEIAQRLVDLALARGGPDNVTVLVAQVE